jgi:hypothetical protein
MHMVTISIAALTIAFTGGLIFGFGVHVGQQLPAQAVYHTSHGQHHQMVHKHQGAQR